ncbi:MAG: EamA family transporter [Methanolinea sp.]
MIWSLLALTGAIAQAAYSTGVKVLLSKVSPYYLAGCSFLVASCVFCILSSLAGVPELSSGFLPAVAVTVAINILATILSYRALSTSDLSLCLPMLAFTPVFLLLTSFLILGEVPALAGILGIFLVAMGSFLLASGEPPTSFLAPLVTLSRNSGVRMMLIVAFLYSISVNYDKVVVETAGPIFGSTVVYGLLAASFLALTAAGWVRGNVMPVPEGVSNRSMIILIAIGLVLAVEAISVNLAYTLSIVPYVISIKRLSIFFAVLFGGFLLREGSLRPRALGSLVMVAGTVLIALWG